MQLFILFKKRKKEYSLKFEFNKKAFVSRSKEIIKNSFPIIIVGLMLPLSHVIDSFVIPFMLFLSFVQTFISYIFIIMCSQKLQISIIYKDEKKYFYGVFAAIFGFLSFIFAFLDMIKWINFTLFLCSIYFFVLMMIDFKYKNVVEIVMLIISVIFAIIMYVILFRFIPYPNHICVTSISTFIYGFYYSIKRGIFER